MKLLKIILSAIVVYAVWAAIGKYVIGVTLDRADLFVLSCAATAAVFAWFDE